MFDISFNFYLFPFAILERYGTLKASLEGPADDEVRCSPSSNAIGLQGLHEIDGKESITVNLKQSDAEPEKSNLDNGCAVFVLKMAQKGIVSIFLENNSVDDPVDILSKVHEDILKGTNCPIRSFLFFCLYFVICCFVEKVLTEKSIRM